MKKIAKALIMAFILSYCGQVMAQMDAYLCIGASIPTGNYAKGDIDNWALYDDCSYGGAGIGFSGGLKFNFGVGVNGLSLMLTVDGIYNNLNTNIKDYYSSFSDMLTAEYNGGSSLTTEKYVNLPMMLGINYTYYFNPEFGIYAETAAGLNWRIITKQEWVGTTLHDDGEIEKKTVTYKYNSAYGFAFRAGIGIEAGERLIVGLNYLYVGGRQASGRKTNSVYFQGITAPVSEKFENGIVSPKMFLVSLGFRL